ncbi:MAG: 2-C-methyl-D-erythritol 4-phosphate cytidylyltransferase, partial [Dehalococcoidia bacterium]
RYPKKVSVCSGGRRRQDSARAGLSALGECGWVVVHDGARPCIEPDLLERGISHAMKHGNAVAALPVTDTIKSADAQGYVTCTLARRELWAVQTPQIFPFHQLKDAYDSNDQDATDDAALVERLGGSVKLYLGSYENIKVTTSLDLSLAEAILARRKTEP